MRGMSNLIHSGIDPANLPILKEMTAELLSRRFTMTLLTYGRSMNPLIVDGSLVEVICCPIERFKVGDIVLVWIKPNKFLIHRIIHLENKKLDARVYTKGDASSIDLQCFTAETCIGKVVKIISGYKQFNMQSWIWVPINPTVAFLSHFSASLSDHLHCRYLNPKLMKFLQTLSSSILKRIIYFGKRYSEFKALQIQRTHAQYSHLK